MRNKPELLHTVIDIANGIDFSFIKEEHLLIRRENYTINKNEKKN